MKQEDYVYQPPPTPEEIRRPTKQIERPDVADTRYITQKLIKYLQACTGVYGCGSGYHPLIAEMTGSNDAALLLFKIIHWTEYAYSRFPESEGWFFHRHQEWAEELYISEYQVNSALYGNKSSKKNHFCLTDMGVEVEKRPLEIGYFVTSMTVTFYRIDFKKLIESIDSYLSIRNPNKVHAKSPRKNFSQSGSKISSNSPTQAERRQKSREKSEDEKLNLRGQVLTAAEGLSSHARIRARESLEKRESSDSKDSSLVLDQNVIESTIEIEREKEKKSSSLKDPTRPPDSRADARSDEDDSKKRSAAPRKNSSGATGKRQKAPSNAKHIPEVAPADEAGRTAWTQSHVQRLERHLQKQERREEVEKLLILGLSYGLRGSSARTLSMLFRGITEIGVESMQELIVKCVKYEAIFWNYVGVSLEQLILHRERARSLPATEDKTPQEKSLNESAIVDFVKNHIHEVINPDPAAVAEARREAQEKAEAEAAKYPRIVDLREAKPIILLGRGNNDKALDWEVKAMEEALSKGLEFTPIPQSLSMDIFVVLNSYIVRSAFDELMPKLDAWLEFLRTRPDCNPSDLPERFDLGNEQNVHLRNMYTRVEDYLYAYRVSQFRSLPYDQMHRYKKLYREIQLGLSNGSVPKSMLTQFHLKLWERMGINPDRVDRRAVPSYDPSLL